MAKEAKKPTGWGAFDALTRKLVAVPKEEVNAKIKTDKKARLKARRKK